ncbi:MAG: ABC transporter substrate-binding protein [Hyphomicrobiales bacterium]
MTRGMLAMLALAALLLAACGKEQAPVEARPTATPTLSAPTVAGSRTVKDMIGRDVAVTEHVDRVVAMSPTALQFAEALGLEVLGRPSDSPAEGAEGAQTVGTTILPDFPAIAALKPDLVLADAAYHGSRLRDFEQFPYPVFVLKAGSYQDVLAATTALGQVTGRDDRAAEVNADIQQRVEAARAEATGTPPRVLILTGSGREVYGGSDATYLGSLVNLLGGTNVLANEPQGAPIAGFGLVEITQVATLDPDVVLVIASGQGGLADQVRSAPEWAESKAVQNDRVFELDTALYLRAPGPSVGDAVEQLAGMLY